MRNLEDPDESIRLPGIEEDMLEIAGMTVGRSMQEPGWRWSRDMRPFVGGEWCESHHVGYVLSGRQRIVLQDGTTFDVAPGISTTSRRGTTRRHLGTSPS